MDMLKKLWPTPFGIKKGDLTSFLVQLIIFVVACILVGFLIGLLAKIFIIGVIFAIIGSLFELYGIIGVVLCILRFCGVV